MCISIDIFTYRDAVSTLVVAAIYLPLDPSEGMPKAAVDSVRTALNVGVVSPPFFNYFLFPLLALLPTIYTLTIYQNHNNNKNEI